VGTNGSDHVSAYVVAGRSLYVVALAGTPPRWSATSLALQGGEPVEVWMDNPFGGLGRVGYRDGEVFTLPGGFLLVNELPRDAGAPPQVLDYENLGGWPVAMTNNGLYVANYDLDDAGHLENRFDDGGINRPIEWRKLPYDGGVVEPWLGKSSRLQVTVTLEQNGCMVPVTNLMNPVQPTNVRVFHLLVYTDEQVVEVAQLCRR
jgi:hypothetical protein